MDEKDRSRIRREPDDISDTFEEYLEKSNMLSHKDRDEHYFLPNSQKSDFV